MEDEVRERFERIERNLERVGERMGERMDQFDERMDRITEAHLDLEAAQKNTTVLLNRFIEESAKRGAELDERIANLTILVDQLIKKNFNGN